MIKRNDKDLRLRYYGAKAIITVYLGARLIWQSITSCFGAGWWNNNKAWFNNETWK